MIPSHVSLKKEYASLEIHPDAAASSFVIQMLWYNDSAHQFRNIFTSHHKGKFLTIFSYSQGTIFIK